MSRFKLKDNNNEWHSIVTEEEIQDLPQKQDVANKITLELSDNKLKTKLYNNDSEIASSDEISIKSILFKDDSDIEESGILWESEDEPDYLCFFADEDTDISFVKVGEVESPDLQYRINEGAWLPYIIGEKVHLTSGDICYWKGNNQIFSDSSNNYVNFQSTGFIRASGNIMSLIDETCESITIPSDYCFARLFCDCDKLLTPPELPATNLSEGCYSGMFESCWNLDFAPELPATELQISCYDWMFEDCYTIKETPVLTATYVPECAYEMMFYGCKSLTKITSDIILDKIGWCGCLEMFESCDSLVDAGITISADSYDEDSNQEFKMMFSCCKNLEIPPKLPSMNINQDIYEYMFDCCDNLKYAPELPATTLYDWCYCNMFSECPKLEQIPKLPATELKYGCYRNMFDGCSSLKLSETQGYPYFNEYRIPYSGEGIDADSAMNDMFRDTGGTFTGNPEINTTYYTSNEVV